MRILVMIGAALAASGLVVLIVGNLGDGISGSSVVGGGVLFVIGSTIALSGIAITRSLAKLGVAVRDLETRGIRRTGRVRDAVPYAAPDGGTVLQPDGAQMVLQIDFERVGGGTETVTCHIVEASEAARARIGKDIVVLQHPDDSTLRAIEGFLPNGRPRT